MSDVLDRPLVREDLTAAAARYAAASRGAGTARAYDSQWGQFVEWCEAEGFDPFSGEMTVALNIAAMATAGRAVTTISVRLAAIQDEYRKADVPLNMADCDLAPVREGITRSLGTAARRKAAPATPDALRPMLASRRPASDPQGARDRLLLLLGFGAALRRSELVALAIGDVVEIHGRGLRVTIRRSKADQAGAGQNVHVASSPLDPAFCPVVALRQWLTHRAGASDMDCAPAERLKRPLLCAVDKAGKLSGEGLADKTVARVIKAAADAAGFDADAFSGHSLRRGLLTAGAEAGGDLKGLMRHARQTNPKNTMGYIDEADPWSGNVSVPVFGAGA